MIRSHPILPFLSALSLALLLSSCGGGRLLRASSETPGEWETASPAEVGIDSTALNRLLADLPPEDEHGLHSMLIVRHGRLVMERYWNGHDRNVLHDLRSATKSITSLLTGIAIDQGFLRGTSDSMLSWLGRSYPDADAGKRGITLEHLLTMRSGLACNDRDDDSPGQEDRMYRSRDWVRYFLDLPIERPPGDSAIYCTGGVVALGRVITEASGQSLPEFSRRYLFGPLGIEHFQWSTFDRDSQTDAGGHLYLRPRDMAKIGLLVLRRGEWGGRQVVSASWIERSTSMQTRIDGGKPYGYLWWLAGAQYGEKVVKIIHAHGNGGQMIFIVPELDLVSVFTGGNYNSPKGDLPIRILGNAILPAVEELKPYPGRPEE